MSNVLDWYGVIQAVVLVVAGVLLTLCNRQFAALAMRSHMRRWRRPRWIGKEPTPEVAQRVCSAVNICGRVMTVIVGVAFLVYGLSFLVKALGPLIKMS